MDFRNVGILPKHNTTRRHNPEDRLASKKVGIIVNRQKTYLGL